MKISKIEKIGKRKVFDLSVAEAEHYVLENGVVTHNTGIYYSASTIWIIGRRQDKIGTEVKGYHFIIKVEKSRYVREQSKIPISVGWDKGIMRWSGLLDVALESGWVKKPKKGWYEPYANPDDKEPSGKSVREKATFEEAFWTPFLANSKFTTWITERFAISNTTMLEADEDVELED